MRARRRVRYGKRAFPECRKMVSKNALGWSAHRCKHCPCGKVIPWASYEAGARKCGDCRLKEIMP